MRPNRRVRLRHSSQECGRHRLRRKRGGFLAQGLQTGVEAATSRRAAMSCLGSTSTRSRRRRRWYHGVRKLGSKRTSSHPEPHQPASASGQGAHPSQQKFLAMCDGSDQTPRDPSPCPHTRSVDGRCMPNRRVSASSQQSHAGCTQLNTSARKTHSEVTGSNPAYH